MLEACFPSAPHPRSSYQRGGSGLDLRASSSLTGQLPDLADGSSAQSHSLGLDSGVRTLLPESAEDLPWLRPFCALAGVSLASWHTAFYFSAKQLGGAG